MKMRIYYGWNIIESRVMFATITGQMSTGQYVYTECDAYGKLIDIDKQYLRTLKHGAQMFEII